MPFFKVANQMHQFVHMPKCAGMSVEAYLETRFGSLAFIDNRYYKTPPADRWSKSSPQHIEAAAVEKLFPEGWIKESFTIVRNPIARFASSYNYYLANLKHIPRLMDAERWFAEYRGFVKRRPHYMDNHLRPQTEMVPSACRVFKLEDRFDQVVAYLDGLAGNSDGPREIGHGHKTQNPTGMVRAALSTKLLGQLRSYYAADFERFGYDPKEDAKATVFVPNLEEWSLVERLRQRRKLIRRQLWGASMLALSRTPE